MQWNHAKSQNFCPLTLLEGRAVTLSVISLWNASKSSSSISLSLSSSLFPNAGFAYLPPELGISGIAARCVAIAFRRMSRSEQVSPSVRRFREANEPRVSSIHSKVSFSFLLSSCFLPFRFISSFSRHFKELFPTWLKTETWVLGYNSAFITIEEQVMNPIFVYFTKVSMVSFLKPFRGMK